MALACEQIGDDIFIGDILFVGLDRMCRRIDETVRIAAGKHDRGRAAIGKLRIGWEVRGPEVDPLAAQLGQTLQFDEPVALAHGRTLGQGHRTRLLPEAAEHDRPEMDGFERRSMPRYLWMPATDVVRESLAYLGREKVIVIPGLLYKWMVAGLQSWLVRVPLIMYQRYLGK